MAVTSHGRETWALMITCNMDEGREVPVGNARGACIGMTVENNYSDKLRWETQLPGVIAACKIIHYRLRGSELTYSVSR